jgi:hypothetical protein
LGDKDRKAADPENRVCATSLYIMRRTQLYLDDDIWNALHIQARQAGTSISELVRQALRDRHGNSPENRVRAMQDWVGIWQSRKDLPDSETYVRRLRKGTRLRRIAS